MILNVTIHNYFIIIHDNFQKPNTSFRAPSIEIYSASPGRDKQCNKKPVSVTPCIPLETIHENGNESEESKTVRI